MKQIAVDKALVRLAKAKESLGVVKRTKNYEEFSSAWTDFLTYNNTIYNILEKGSHGKPQSKQWFFSQQKKFKKDPLICYLIQARNSDEHGIEPITGRDPGGIGINLQNKTKDGLLPNVYVNNGKVRIEGTGEPCIVEILPPKAKLVPVKDDRFGTTFDPPSSHLGSSIDSQHPYDVGRLGYEFAERFIQDAHKLV